MKKQKKKFNFLRFFGTLIFFGILILPLYFSYMNFKYEKYEQYDYLNKWLSEPNIIDLTMMFPASPYNDNSATYIILHHDSIPHHKSMPIVNIHNFHVSQGFVTFGYHYYITRCGTIMKFHNHSERTAHAGIEWNRKSIGVCVSGNFETNKLTNNQSIALSKLIQYFKKPVKLHSEVSTTKCPGAYFKYAIKYHFLEKI
jgi:hypothetical protein